MHEIFGCARLCVMLLLVVYTSAFAADSDCGDAHLRISKAQARIENSVRRTTVATIRVLSELKRMGSTIAAPVEMHEIQAQPWQVPTQRLLEETEAVARFADAAIKEISEVRFAGEAQRENPLASRPNDATVKRECVMQAQSAEEAAFRAEQAAQVAEIAADQAVNMTERKSNHGR